MSSTTLKADEIHAVRPLRISYLDISALRGEGGVAKVEEFRRAALLPSRLAEISAEHEGPKGPYYDGFAL